MEHFFFWEWSRRFEFHDIYLKPDGHPCINGCFNWMMIPRKSSFLSIQNWLFGVPGRYYRYAQIATCVKGPELFWNIFFPKKNSPFLWESIRQIVFRTLSSTWKWMVGRWSFPFGAKGLFSGRTVSFRGVIVCRCLETTSPAPRRPIPKVNQHHSTQVLDPANLVSPRKKPMFWSQKKKDPTVFFFRPKNADEMMACGPSNTRHTHSRETGTPRGSVTSWPW